MGKGAVGEGILIFNDIHLKIGHTSWWDKMYGAMQRISMSLQTGNQNGHENQPIRSTI